MTLDELRALATGERDEYTVWEGDLGKMAVTLEDAELLYALVRLVKPDCVLELGTGMGVSGRFIAEALAVNGRGELWTFEPAHDHAFAAHNVLTEDLPAHIVEWLDEIPPEMEPDLVFVDSGWETRRAEIRLWLTNGYTGLVVVHDSERRYPELDLGVGVFLPGTDGLWIGGGA